MSSRDANNDTRGPHHDDGEGGDGVERVDQIATVGVDYSVYNSTSNTANACKDEKTAEDVQKYARHDGNFGFLNAAHRLGVDGAFLHGVIVKGRWGIGSSVRHDENMRMGGVWVGLVERRTSQLELMEIVGRPDLGLQRRRLALDVRGVLRKGGLLQIQDGVTDETKYWSEIWLLHAY